MYILNNNIHFTESDFRSIDSIPVGNWLVMYNDNNDEFYLKAQSDFSLPKKLYGNCNDLTAKFLNTFRNRNKNLGVLLSGLKGTGKSLLSRNICVESGLPVLILTEAYQGTTFINFLNKINEECVIFLDEFEKVYYNSDDNTGQNSLLSILDGVFSNKFLFLLTINETNRLSDYLINRPGRIHYHIKYEGLDNSIIEDVVDDILENKNNREKVIHICHYLGDVSMDILTSLIAECNLYPNIEPNILIKDMNLECTDTTYDYEITSKASNLVIIESTTTKNPLSRTYFHFEYYVPNKKVKSDGDWYSDKIIYNDEDDKAIISYEGSTIKIENSKYIAQFKKAKKYKYEI